MPSGAVESERLPKLLFLLRITSRSVGGGRGGGGGGERGGGGGAGVSIEVRLVKLPLPLLLYEDWLMVSARSL